jgi:hypothetical protein
MKHRLLDMSALAVVVTLAGCADSGAGYRPILDGPETQAYRADLAACQELARDQRQFDEETAGAAALGAGIGAVAGLVDDDTSDAEGLIGGALVGGVAGGAAGAIEASSRREDIVVECLRGRGYRVVG